MTIKYKYYSYMIEEGYNAIQEQDDSVGKLYLHSLKNCTPGYFIDQALEKLSINNDIEIINGYNREDRFNHIVIKTKNELPEEKGNIDIDGYGSVDYMKVEPNIYKFTYVEE